MKLSYPMLALVLAAGIPLSACAQQSNAAENGGPSPEIRAQMQQARDTAKTASLNDLSPATRAKVQSIIDDVNSGKQTDLRAAAQQIDAALSPAESKAVLGERDKMTQTMRANMPPRPDGAGPQGGPGNGPGPSGAPPNGAMHGGGMWGGAAANDAGRFLLSLGVSREKMRELRHKQQPPAAQ
jgi:hypothetical protein